ncbi:SpoIIE family protein phosphatase [Streptomyces sp. DT2A-34]|uniref:ATP-binding SpoIIE family protein phosphatase n=1 Tax=Streptomyces sp. DT2A-34 TaxID=3051182 RepID=UPI00265C5AA7|nr:SpoIIE family protein phosphatase [Streptomyces sp. DT2A-34]MDO0916561.1 SpoIIE family protein phosphatase [Streptomyces sp. DT2A-34]
MGTDVDVLLCDLARGLRPRSDQLTDALIQRLRSDVPQLWKFEDIAAPALVATSEHVNNWLDVLEYGFDVAEVKAPPAAVECARLIAEHGIPISVLLRSYRLGHASLLQLLQEETARLIRDPELINAVSIALSALGFEYVDRTSEQAVAAYQEERDRRLQRKLIVINEAGTRIGTTLDITHTAQELADVGTDHFADVVTVDLVDAAFREAPSNPAADSPALRRIAQQSVGGDSPNSAVDTGQIHTYPEGSEAARALVTGHSLLQVTSSDNPSGWAESPDRSPTLHVSGIHSMLLVPLCARGSTLGLVQFLRHQTAVPFDDDDLLLAQEIASRAAVNIDNARRYTHERSTALTLQRSLLSHHVPEQSAVETASRYLPSGSRAGVGGDWYDVIPLSGARVALVVGDVVGRGINAAATMGRLRTAVRTLADIDLPPDELLTHLDDVVIRLQSEEERDSDEISATCLYAVYDPVSRQCSIASAGHVVPTVLTPRTADGVPDCRAVAIPEMPIGPPLGLGGFPFEAAQFELPEGSLLALYTDGLIESRTRDVDTALTLLRRTLARAPVSLEDTCDILLSALQPGSPIDDIALLMARTRVLDADHIATLDIPPDPAVVSRARAYASDQLAAWGLEEMVFSTELMVSELVTNAIRYGKGPIQLRLILESALTCEVSDTSSTAPHMRRARAFDEGGRGLLLVAQIAARWGTRHSRDGKVIWAEQPLVDAQSSAVS